MKIFDPKCHLPPGWPWERTQDGLIWGHTLSGLTIFGFFSRFSDALSNLYIYTRLPDGSYQKELDPGQTIAPFSVLIRGTPLLGLWLFLAVMPLLVWRYYSYHTRGTMAVYTMRRLPDKWEYHRRCWTQPLLSAVTEFALYGILIFFCWLLWRFGTPAECLPH